jgi:hypothetical protein
MKNKKNVLKELFEYIINGYINKEKLLVKLEGSYLLMEANSSDKVEKILNEELTGISRVFWSQLRRTRAVTVSAVIPVVKGGERTNKVFITIKGLDFDKLSRCFVCDEVCYSFADVPVVGEK